MAKQKKNSNKTSIETGPRNVPMVSSPTELSPDYMILEQNREVARQDEQLVDLEASILNLRDASVSISQEVTLQSGLLDEVSVRVDRTQGQQDGMQSRLRQFMRKSGTCKLWSLIAVLGFVLILLLVAFK
jgi:hypothetical protein